MSLQILSLKLDGITAGDYLTGAAVGCPAALMPGRPGRPEANACHDASGELNGTCFGQTPRIPLTLVKDALRAGYMADAAFWARTRSRE